MNHADAAGLTWSRVLSVRAGSEAPAPDLLALARSRALDPEVFDEFPPLFFAGEISSSRWDAYDTRMGVSTLRNYAAAAADGVAFLRGHTDHESPIGHTLTGRFIAAGGNGVSRVTADMYALPLEDAAPFVQRLRAGVVRDLSVGFSGGEYICTICHKDMAQWLTRNGCPHLLGMMYQPKDEAGTAVGEPQKARATIENAQLAEVSGVYDGACPGSMIAKARAMAAAGLVSADERELVRVRYRLAELAGSARYWRGAETDDTPTRLPDTILGRLRALGMPAPSPDIAAWFAREAGAIDLTTADEGRRDRPAPDALETGPGGEMDDRATTLPEPVLSRLRGLGMPAAEPEPGVWAAREIEGLRPLADDGRAYRADLVRDALAEGVRAHGADFAAETYRGLLETAPLEIVKKMRDDWRKQADEKLAPGSGSGRLTLDTAPPPEPETAVTHYGPAGAYRA